MLLGTGIIITDLLLNVNPFSEKSFKNFKKVFCVETLAKIIPITYNKKVNLFKDGETIWIVIPFLPDCVSESLRSVCFTVML